MNAPQLAAVAVRIVEQTLRRRIGAVRTGRVDHGQAQQSARSADGSRHEQGRADAVVTRDRRDGQCRDGHAEEPTSV